MAQIKIKNLMKLMEGTMTKHSCISIALVVFILSLVCASQSFAHGNITGTNDDASQQIISDDSNDLLTAGRIKRPVKRFQPFPKAPAQKPAIEYEDILLAGKKTKPGTRRRWLP